MGSLEGRVALITGGAHGIGYAVAQAMCSEGARVVIMDIDAEAVNSAALHLQKQGAQTKSVICDVSDCMDVNTKMRSIAENFGAVDILVHSAGIGLEKSFFETSADEWRRVLDVDLSGAFYCCQAAAREMAKRKYGRIITLASTAGVRGGWGRAAYGAAKGGIIALTRVMAVELANSGVTVNAIAPGAIETELVARMHSDETRISYTRAIPLNRYGTVEEVAAAAVFLATAEASYISGHTLAVDGGFLAAGLLRQYNS